MAVATLTKGLLLSVFTVSASFGAGAALADDRTIAVAGQGQVAVTPDMARVSVGVSADAEDADVAMTQMSDALAKVIAHLEVAGIAKADIQTGQLSLSPRYEYPPEKGPVLVGFNASSTLNLRVRDLTVLPLVLDAVVKEGANTISGVSFDLANAEEAQNEARRRAVADALARAKLYAEAAGVQLGELVYLSEGGGAYPPPMPMLRMGASADIANPAPVEGGEVNFSASVNLVYEIKDK